MKEVKIDINAIKEQALDEYTEIIKTITLIAHERGSSTIFLLNLERSAKDILWAFLFNDKRQKP